MKHCKISIPILAVLLIAGCSGNSRKLTLPPAEESSSEKLTVNAQFEAETVLDTIIPRPGVKFKEVRKSDPSVPPVRLNLAQVSEEKAFTLTDYYSSVKYVKLKHPFAEQGRGFLANIACTVTFESGGGMMSSGTNSSVFLTDGNIVAGDFVFGYHCYDREGNFIYTIAAMEELPEYGNTISMQLTSQTTFITRLSVFDDNCVIQTMRGRDRRMELHNIASRKTYLSRPYSGARAMLLSPESFISYQYSVLAPEREPFMYAFETKGDTLCGFMNGNPLVPSIKKGVYTNPDGGEFYYYNSIPTVRQAYNDTVYRVTAPNELTAAYVLDLGERKVDVATALFGDKSGRLIPNEWIEADRFVLITHTENYDCPNNRNNHSVKFFYSCYDKATGRLYRIPFDGFPDDFLLPNGMDDGLPFFFGNIRVHDRNLYVCYTKAQLENILKDKNFASLPPAQQEKARALHDELDKGEMLVMILE
jgi:hypothetical protein